MRARRKLRWPGWMNWLALIWFSSIVHPSVRGVQRIDWFLVLTSWMLGLVGLDIGMCFVADFTERGYWYPGQLATAFACGVLLFLIGAFLGPLCASRCYLLRRDVLVESTVPAQDVYPPDPRSGIEKGPTTPKKRVGDTQWTPIWWRILVTFCLGIGGSFLAVRSLSRLAEMPRLPLEVLVVQSSSRSIPGWVRVQIPHGTYEVQMPGSPEIRSKDASTMVLFESDRWRFHLYVTPLPKGTAHDSWPRLWANLRRIALGSSHLQLQRCTQDGIEGMNFTFDSTEGGVIQGRILLAKENSYLLLTAGADGQALPRTAQLFMDSFRSTPVPAQRWSHP